MDKEKFKQENTKQIFKFLNDSSKLTFKQEELINSFEFQFTVRGHLSEKQMEILLDIYERA